MKQKVLFLLATAAMAVAYPVWGADSSAHLNADANDEMSARGPMKLSLRRAVQLATSPEGSTRMQLQMESLKQAKNRSDEVRASLLPDIESYVGISSSVHSLAADGLTDVHLQPINILNGFYTFNPDLITSQIPSRVGPYHTLDMRGTANQVAFDYSIITRLKSAHANVRAAKQDVNTVDDQVTAQVARAYLNALRSDAEVEAAQADVDLSEAVAKQSAHQKEAGTGTGIDITRSNVQVANDKQRLLVARNDQTKAHLQLLRVMNLRMDASVDLTDKLVYKPVDSMTVPDAVARAIANRPDLKAQLEREDSAKLNARAVRYERLPSVVTQFNYGDIGPQDVHLVPTRTIYGAVRIPIFDGGRRDSRRQEAYSQFKQESVRSADLRDQIELDVRSALDSLNSAAEQVAVANDGLKLAETELAQARRRYDAGVAGSLDVTDASDRVQRARTNQIQAVFNHNLARIDLGQSLGKTISMID